MKLKILLILLIPLLIASCSFFYKTKEKSGDDIFIVKRSPRAIILDFYNLSKNEKYNDFGFHVSERMHKDLKEVFSVYDPYYTRNYIKKQKYTSENIYNPEIAVEIGKVSNADLVLRGMYNIIGNEVQIVGEIMSLTSELESSSIKFTSSVDTFFSSFDDYLSDFKDVCLEKYPVIEENTKQKIETQAVKNITNPIKMEEIVDKYIKKEKIETGKPAIDDPLLIEYENPSPPPEWLKNIPKEPGRIYFVGQAFDGDDYQSTLELAIQDAYLQISRAIGTKVESTYQKIIEISSNKNNDEVKEQIVKSMLIETLGNIRNADRQQIYYCRRLKTKKYEVAVLYSIERTTLEKLIAESIIIETQKIEKEKLNIELKLTEAKSAAEKNEIKQELATLKAKVAVYQNLIKEKEGIIKELEENSVLKTKYKTHEEIVYETSLPDNDNNEDLIDYQKIGLITGGGGLILAGLGGTLFALGAIDSNKADDIYYNQYAITPTSSSNLKTSDELDSLLTDAQSLHDSGGLKKGFGIPIFGLGMLSITAGIFTYFYFPDTSSESRISFHIYPFSDTPTLAIGMKF